MKDLIKEIRIAVEAGVMLQHMDLIDKLEEYGKLYASMESKPERPPSATELREKVDAVKFSVGEIAGRVIKNVSRDLNIPPSVITADDDFMERLMEEIEVYKGKEDGHKKI